MLPAVFLVAWVGAAVGLGGVMVKYQHSRHAAIGCYLFS